LAGLGGVLADFRSPRVEWHHDHDGAAGAERRGRALLMCCSPASPLSRLQSHWLKLTTNRSLAEFRARHRKIFAGVSIAAASYTLAGAT
jgi:hypothetical protein